MKKIKVIILLLVFFLGANGSALASNINQKNYSLVEMQNILKSLMIMLKDLIDQRFKQSMDQRIVNRFVSWGHDKVAEKRHVDTVVVHSIYDALGNNPHDVEGVIHELKIYNVSSHYLISREGVIYRLVKDNDLAWHAGHSKLVDGRTGVNKFSIGIELLHHEKEEASEVQYQALVDLVKYLKLNYDIKHITGHTDISLTKKTDP